MLPLLTRRLRVVLHPDRVVVTTIERGWRPVAGKSEIIHCDLASGAQPWKAPLDALQRWLQSESRQGSDVDFTLSDSLVHYAHVSWSEHVQTSTELKALARAVFSDVYGTVAASWTVTVDMTAYGAHGVACAVDSRGLQELKDICTANRLRLRRLSPLFMEVFNCRSGAIVDAGLIAVVEGNRCVLACVKDGMWHSIRTLSVGDGGLDVLIAREILLQGLPADARQLRHVVGEVPLEAA